MLTLVYLGIALTTVWGVWLVRTLLVFRNRPQLWAAFNDERVRQNRLKAWSVGFWALMIVQALTIIPIQRYHIPVGVVFQFNVLLATVASCIDFLRRDATE